MYSFDANDNDAASAPPPASPPAPNPVTTPAPGPQAKTPQPPAPPAPPAAEGQGAEGELAIEGEGHPLTFPSGLPSTVVTEDATAMLSEFGILAKSAGVSQAEADHLVRLYTDVALSEAHAVDASSRESVLGWLHLRWGEDFESKMKAVHATVAKHGPTFKRWLEATRLGDSPAMLVALAEYGAGTSKLSQTQAKKELDAIMSDPKSPYWSGSKSAVDRVRLLSEIAHAEPGEERARELKREEESPTARLDREIKLAEQDAAYYDSGTRGTARRSSTSRDFIDSGGASRRWPTARAEAGCSCGMQAFTAGLSSRATSTPTWGWPITT